jgi:hypothetical protein
LIYASSGVLRRLIQGTNVTLDAATTPGGIIISAASGGSGVAALTDAETTTGFTLIYNSTGVLLRLISQDTSIVITNNGQTLGIKTGLADAETSTGVTLLGATNGQIKRLIAGTNVTLDPATTPGGVIINAAAGGGGVASLTDAETSAGVTIISSSTGVLKRLVAGANITLTPDSPTAGGVTIASSGGSGGFAPNHTQAIRNVAWTYADATVIPWTGVNWDTDTKWALTPNPSRLTIVTAGYYQVTVQLAFTPAAGSGTIEVNVTVNGGTHPRIGTQSILNGSVNPGSMLISGVLKLNAADYVEVFPLMQTGAAPTALAYVSTGIGNPYGPFFQLDYLGT